jgi:hypothetical protein
LAVTDDTQVNQDTLTDENIITRLLLTGDLKGYIEEPGYYLQAKNSEALDNMLLTQGWVSYDWLDDPKHPAFAAEDEFAVKGQVQNILNKPVKETKVTLLSKSPLIEKDTLTNGDGHFTFRNFPVIDTPAFIIKAVNRHDKSFNVGIVMNDGRPPMFASLTGPAMQPWYVSSDTALLNSAKNTRIRIEQQYLDPNSHLLKEVKITAKKFVKNSQNLNGPGNADLVFDEKDMVKAAKKSWLQLFQEKIPGFRLGTWVNRFTHFPQNLYYINDQILFLVVDGESYSSKYIFTGDVLNYFIDFDNYLKFQNAEDIKGMEVMSSSKYASKYSVRFDLPLLEYTFVEITTRSGKGPLLPVNTPGVYLYKPLPLSQPKQFYKPRYALNDTAKHLSDTRSTIDWEPNIETDKNGQAVISFFAADKPTSYTLIVEGIDMNGNLGYRLKKLVIKNKQPDTKL